MSRFNTLLLGEAKDAEWCLDQPDITQDELRAALCNALNRIDRLESQVANLQKDTNE